MELSGEVTLVPSANFRVKTHLILTMKVLCEGFKK